MTGRAGSGSARRFVLASANPKKAAEIAEILGDRVHLIPRPTDVPDVVEDAATFEGNARLKAVALVRATGEPAIADDSGLIVDALDGAPGVRSARYAGEDASDEDNVRLLLAALADVPPAERTARFHCVVLARWPDGREVVAQGTVEGHITAAPRGSAGFGYDPVFVPEGGGGLTFAELGSAPKHAISHRGRALRSLADQLPPTEANVE
ncbi:MAG: non-canonical purine pyrophosphatase, RdgB/HAM1 family [Acidimicrobiales bacterium]|nr:non-canonical purine pyrophosphatase, RdgB/HAM1 family [Acidimicrobiales bacterium]